MDHLTPSMNNTQLIFPLGKACAHNYYKDAMHNINLIIQILIFIIGLTVSLFSTALTIPRVDSDIQIDGKLDEKVWQQAQTLNLHNVTSPYENLPAPVATTVKYFENGDTLYVAFKAQDPNPEQIRSFFHERDRANRDDLVGIRLDPYGDHRLVFQFLVNPYGVQNDSTVDVLENSTSDSWDGIWDSAGKITEDGYQIEIAIPLRNFNFNSEQQTQTWAMEFVRFYPRTEQYRLSHITIDRNNECLPCQMATVTGFKDIHQGKSLSITPTFVADHQETRDLYENTGWMSDDDYEVGLDIKWGVSSDIFLNATFNPDFSQIEADDAQINLNDNFTLTLEEKRPFFLENQDIFSADFDLVYTRNIGAPNFGAKVTGRSGNHAYGVFIADDDNTTFFVPGNLNSRIATLGQSSNNAALRYRYDANKDFNIGFIGTLRTSDDYHNYVGSTDFRYKITDQDILTGHFIVTDTQYPEFLSDKFCSDDDCENEDIQCSFANCNISESYLRTQSDDNLTGFAYRMFYSHDERHWFMNYRYQEISSDFRSDLGNQVRVDQNRVVAQAGLKFWGDSDDWWTQFNIWGDWDILRNDDREVLENELEIDFELYGPMQSELWFRYMKRDEVGSRLDSSILDIDGNTTMFELDVYEFTFEIQPYSGLFLGLNGDLGDRIDFRNNRKGHQIRLYPSIEYSFAKHFRASLNYEYNNLKADSKEVFTARVADFRFNYNLDLRHTFKLSLIYTEIDFNLDNQPALTPALLPSASETDLSSQFIYSYKINPQTVIFAGYSDHSLKNALISSLKRDSQKVFLKLSYAWLK